MCMKKKSVGNKISISNLVISVKARNVYEYYVKCVRLYMQLKKRFVQKFFFLQMCQFT